MVGETGGTRVPGGDRELRIVNRLENSNLFVITGGPGSGKTTVLHELEKRGFRFAPEVARQIIQEQVQNRGSALPWSDQESYTKLMLERSVVSYKEHTPSSRLTFSDRGIPDTLSYARLIGLSDQQYIRIACSQYRYAPLVFIAPPWREIYETDNERKQDFAEAVRTYEKITITYQECGYELLELPKLTPPDRAEFILNQLPDYALERRTRGSI
jgi:predicted ATPase